MSIHSVAPRNCTKILFEFSKNAFFDNEILEKTYLYQEEVGYSGDFVYDRALGTKIKWKEDKDLTKEFEIKKQRNKNTNRTRLVRKALPTDSFFNFFSPPEPPTDEALENGEFEDEELEELEALSLSHSASSTATLLASRALPALPPPTSGEELAQLTIHTQSRVASKSPHEPRCCCCPRCPKPPHHGPPVRGHVCALLS
ncbi:hypothetical protein HYPSUDRAFT_202536 [Hypholoma sublateritium FD-334 SS-4]|uniref:Uncharacterized protein n=1 Tax=Hypholoma sublateritium (strain FD-334 SS-4) TaxID=945553 RepID=A0A0D2P006_HYPSF|nr:hypothetical protein HYPSUDRAFT_202536 [Hypholoma sublateritium FD-334 SS-4]